ELGLHRALTVFSLPRKRMELYKRIWYSVYVTDRWCCAVMSRPLAISDSDCDIDLPSLGGETDDNEDYSIFVNFIKLSSILGEVLRRIYSPKAKSINLVESTIISTVQTLQQMLTEWFDQLPDNCKITSEDLIRLRQSPENTKKLTEGGPLMLCYYAITMLLHRNFILTENEESPISIQSDSVRRCKEAAARVIDIACIIPRMDIVNFGWNFAGI
ncbi:fungal-specific transcription factor, partial [Phycomyces blakesleeanus NRRL 1555(-)]